MNEIRDEEKLLTSPLDTPEISSAAVEKPLLTTKEFLATTPQHELAHIFGTAPENVFKNTPLGGMPSAAQDAIAAELKKFSEPLPLAEKETVKPETPATAGAVPATPKAPRKHRILRFFGITVLILFVLLVGFYIWGGILKERGFTDTSSQQ